jgi:nitrogen fixation/metabolism regulation signal transduction histidine kinase
VKSSSSHPRVAPALLEALPLAIVGVDGALRVVHANAAARATLGVEAGMALGDGLGCAEARAVACGVGARCAGCRIRDAALRAVGGETVRVRAFVLRSDDRGEPSDLHLLATAAPADVGGARLAVIALDDADRILLDPAVARICAGCGRVGDDDGSWHPLHRYLEDRLGLSPEELCDACAGSGRAI